MFWALMVILVVSVAVAVMGTVLMRPSQGKNVLTRLTDKLYAGYQHIFANVPVVFKELHKLLVTSRGFTVIVVLLLVVMYFISYGKMAFLSARSILSFASFFITSARSASRVPRFT